MKKITIAVAFSAALIVPIFGQTPGETDNPEFAPPSAVANQIQDDKNVSDVIDQFLNSKSQVWTEGENTKKNGERFFLSVGTGIIQAPRNSPSYIQSRINAYEKAILEAKSQMVEFLGTEIETEAQKTIQEGDFNAEAKRLVALKKANTPLSMTDKIRLLIHAKLDKKLKEQGINSNKANVELSKLVNSESFKKMTKTLARARILGSQVYRAFEYSPSGAKGEIGVIMIHSDKLQKIAEAIVTGTPLPSKTPKAPIKDQIPKDSTVLLNMYGVQSKTDENGNVVLVAFSQGAPKTKSRTSIKIAYKKAKISALALIRQFAGENAMVANDMLNSESSKEFEDETTSYQDDNATREKINTFAKKMNIAGIARIYKWKAIHPLTHKMVVGAIYTWSPSSAARAVSLKKKMAEAPQSKLSNSRKVTKNTNKRNKLGQNQSGVYTGAGAAADDDDF
jgi:uncharacterized protein DUF6844